MLKYARFPIFRDMHATTVPKMKSTVSEFLSIYYSSSLNETDLISILIKAISQDKNTKLLSNYLSFKCFSSEGKLCSIYLQSLYDKIADKSLDDDQPWPEILTTILHSEQFDYSYFLELLTYAATKIRQEKVKDACKYIDNIVYCLGALE